MYFFRIPLIFVILLITTSACRKTEHPPIEVTSRFTLLPAAFTGIDFANNLEDELSLNVFKYRNYYNGGGVAIGDVNGDGLADLYLVSNQRQNRLYLNRGDFHFEDITSGAGVAGEHRWSTGACMADVNGDGLLDIYVCNSGNIGDDDRANELFLNQGNDGSGKPRFREAGAAWGVNDPGFATHAAFFDYDRDGDLDLYVLNNAFRPLSTFDLSKNLRDIRDEKAGGDCLYRNDGERFSDVSAEAGILGSVIAFGLGLSVSDVDNDGWMDIYVANDFFEKDYLYLNNQDGTFRESLNSAVRYVSTASMGSDIADLNNDGRMDISTTEMLPEDDYRLKTTFTFDAFDRMARQVEWGYYHQYQQNALQINNGPVPGEGVTFTEIALQAGVAATDWSWGALIADLDNDAYKDILVTNGIFRDVTDQDYLDFLLQQDNIQRIILGEEVNFSRLIEAIPSTPLSNYAFRNQGDLTFENAAREWGLDSLSYSNGAAYGDLDGDGDLDLVINNVNQAAFVYRNESDSLSAHHFLRVRLQGAGKNTSAIGARVTLHAGQSRLVLEQMPMRGFQSSVDHVLHFGLGENESIDSVIVQWPAGGQSIVKSPPANQLITIAENDGKTPGNLPPATQPAPLFADITAGFAPGLEHQENAFDDFKREPLIPRMLSTEGPRIATGDINRDGRSDFFLGGAKGFPGRLYRQSAAGAFEPVNEAVFEKDKICEDVDAVFFDADGDGDQDLYVVSGGNEFSRKAPALTDRLYLNDGRGGFSPAKDRLPRQITSGGCVAVADYDRDGDIDLFIGSRSIPWQYGMTPESYLLQNDGRGFFSLADAAWNDAVSQIGMVTDAAWADIDRDGAADLVVVGEWMPVTVLRNTGQGWENITEAAGLARSNGFWNCLEIADLNGDGYPDLIAGNLGFNSKIRVSEEQPATLYISDFDRNGLLDPITAFYKGGQNYPLPLLKELLAQLPYLRERFPNNASYAGQTVSEVFTPEELEHATRNQVFTTASSVFYGSAAGRFTARELPREAQYSSVFAIEVLDANGDGKADLLLGGNFYGYTPQLGRQDASFGTLLEGDGEGGFAVIPPTQSGIFVRGQVRDITRLKVRGREVVILARNDAPAVVYQEQ